MLMKNPEGESHWCAIPGVSSLSRLTSSNISKSKRARFICTNCIHFTCTTFNKLKAHEKYCHHYEAPVTKLPTKRYIIKFRNERKKIRPPVSIYADFECFQPKINGKNGKFSKLVSQHKPSGFGIYVRARYEDTFPSRYIFFTAKDEKDDVPREFINKRTYENP